MQHLDTIISDHPSRQVILLTPQSLVYADISVHIACPLLTLSFTIRMDMTRTPVQAIRLLDPERENE
jgi:hypothetical protein